MGKKANPEMPARSKKLKSKYKEMFPELATHQQQLVQRHDSAKRQYQKRVIQEDSEEDVELEVLEHQNNDLDTICQTVHRLLSKNKVSAKNAFDVPLIDLQQLPDFTGSLENEYAWKKLSSTLENDYKIYAYRVDAIHSITYNILHTMSRRQQDIDALQPPPENATQPQPVQPLKISEGAESEHLERKIENLNLTQFELALGVDPILERNKRKFDQLGTQNMLLNSLTIDELLALQLVKKTNEAKKYPPWGQYSDIWSSDDPLMAFTELANFRARTAESMEGKMRDEEVYDLFFNEKQNYFNQNYQQHDITIQLTTKKHKEIGKQIKLKPTKYNLIQSEMIDEADHFIDQRSMFLKKNSLKGQVFLRNQIRYENPEDLVNFQLNVDAQQDTRQSIFLGERDKNQFHEDIEDKFLLASRLQTKFQIQKYPLTLKQNPKIVVVNHQNVDVDVRRQQISISDAKRKMKDLIHSRSTFKTLYNGYKQYDEISPALCFLTILHLANEHGFGFDQIDDYNFYIR